MDIVFSLLLVFAGLSAVLIHLKKDQQDKQNQCKQCLDLLINLKILLISIQQHRGLSVGFLHGNASLRPKIRGLENAINQQWILVSQRFPKVRGQPLYEGISSHWGRLQTRWEQLSVSNNIEQHNRLITNLLYLIEDQAANNPHLLFQAKAAGLEIIWKELLETIEAIGQTRAIGMGVVNAGESKALDRIQLKFLIDKAITRLTQLDSRFSSNEQIRGRLKGLKADLAKAKDQSYRLKAFIERYLLTQHCSEVSSDDFFQLATSVIEPLDALFGEAANHLLGQTKQLRSKH